MLNSCVSFKSATGYSEEYNKQFQSVINDPKNSGLIAAADDDLNAKIQLMQLLPETPYNDEFLHKDEKTEKITGLIVSTAILITLGKIVVNSKSFNKIVSFISQKSKSFSECLKK